MNVVLSFSLFDKVNNWFAHWADPFLEACYGDDQMESINKVLTMSGTFANSMWSVVNGLIAIVKPFGIALIVTYFLMFMFDAAAKEQITVDSLVKVLIQLVLVVTLISHLEEIISAVLSVAEGIFQSVSGQDPEAPALTMTGAEMVEQWYAEGEDMGVTIFIQSVLVWLIHQIAVIAVDFAAISRMLELGWRVAFAPIGVANCFEGGAASPAIKYLKGIFATGLAGAAIYVVCIVGFNLSYGFLSDGDFGFGTLLMAQAAMLATAGAAIGISAKIKEVVV